jgi:hypothetical protein
LGRSTGHNEELCSSIICFIQLGADMRKQEIYKLKLLEISKRVLGSEHIDIFKMIATLGKHIVFSVEIMRLEI